AFFNTEPSRVLAAPALIKAEGPFAEHGLMHGDALSDVFSFYLRGYVRIVDPAIAMSSNLVTGRKHGSGRFGIPLQCHSDREGGKKNVALFEQSHQPPKARSATILVEGFDVHIAQPCQGLSGRFRQMELRMRIAMKNVVFAALFNID